MRLLRPFAERVPILALTALSGIAVAMERQEIGPRAVGMGGANVTSAEASALIWQNPALLAVPGPEGTESTGFDAGAGAVVSGELAEALDAWNKIELLEVARDEDLTREQIRQVTLLIGDLSRIDIDSIGIDSYASAGVGIRIGQWGFGVRAFGDTTGFLSDVDLVNLGVGSADVLERSMDRRADQILGMPADDYDIQQLTSDQVDDLQNAGYSERSIKVADFYADELSHRRGFDDGAQQDYVDGLINANDAVDSLAENGTTVSLGTLLVLEMPLSYGYPITPNFDIGASIKAMVGRVYGPRISAFDESAKRLLPTLGYDHQTTWNYGIDLGVLWHVEHWSLALAGRNLNNPRFDGFDAGDHLVEDIDIDPTLVFGVGWFPNKSFEAQAAIDVIEHDFLLRDVPEQYAGIGLQWRIFDPFALRAGASTNVRGENRDELYPVYSGGFAVWIGPVNIDLSVALASTGEEYDDRKVPRVMRAAFGVQAGF